MKCSIAKVSPFLSICLISLVSCLNNADRTNPLDPKSENFKNAGSVSGQTLSFYSPFTPLSEVKIQMEPGFFSAKSNSQGQFVLSNIPVGSYRISAGKEGYAPDTVSVDVQLGQTTQVQLNLDALPGISNISITSSHISRWWPQNDLYLLRVIAQVEDLDGLNDIELVQIQIPELNFLDTLEVTQTLGTFMKNIPQSQLPGGKLQDVLGRDIFLSAHDRAGFQTRSRPNFLARIIEESPEFEAPTGQEILLVPRPLLIWRLITLPFNFSYSVEVVRVDQGINNVVWTLSDIDNTMNSVTVADSLVTGIYFWTISVVDEFGNLSRSKEAGFRIE
ncbi:MAG: carboxypeptidase-like regulatory domain-containing protein [bacterium]